MIFSPLLFDMDFVSQTFYGWPIHSLKRIIVFGIKAAGNLSIAEFKIENKEPGIWATEEKQKKNSQNV